jgi:tRNA-specific 2-thiouridylase
MLNSEAEFDREVITPFIHAYSAGRTPVPCVSCNKDLKFGSLLVRARAWEAVGVATGHYARVTWEPSAGRHVLWRGSDKRKDQSDFLWPLTQAQLGAARFPIGHLTKDEVRRSAQRLGLVTADKPESQEICFIPDDDYRSFLRRRAPSAFRPGRIVAASGAELGRHDGIANYTVGQRRGLGLNSKTPVYVLDLDPTTSTVTVGAAGDLEQTRLIATETNFISCDPPTEFIRVEGKIRHSHVPAPARVRALEPGKAEVVFDHPQRAITPGQSVVWYQGDCVVGGGIISATGRRC